MITLKILTPEEILELEAPARPKISPKERFDRAYSNARGTFNQFRKFHFKAVVSGNRFTLFNGIGRELGEYDYTIAGMREARILASSMFCDATVNKENTNGGCNFSVINGISLENMTEEELEFAELQTYRNSQYDPIKICKNCSFDFETEDFLNHTCVVGTSWVIFGSFKKKFRTKGKTNETN